MNESSVVSPAPARSRRGIHLLVYCALALLVAGPVAWTLHRQRAQFAPISAIDAELDRNGRIRPVAQVLQLVRELKLITASAESTVETTVTDSRWRGTASATVEAPVKYSYGIDLSSLPNESVKFNPISRSYSVVVPSPQRMAVEVDTGRPVQEVIRVSGTRFKKLAGRDQLVLALKALTEEANRQSLPADQIAQIRETTRGQIVNLVLKIIGDKYPIRVRFNDE
jgi:hypothetical protein